jgi:hypothetical protein
MKITLANAVALFAALNFEDCDKWSAERFNVKFTKLGAMLADPEKAKKITKPEDIEDKKIRGLFKSITAELEEGGSVTIDEGDEEEAEEKPSAKPAKASKAAPAAEEEEEAPAKPVKGKPAPAAKPAAKASKPAAKLSTGEGKDKFGSRIGSGAAAINAALLKTPQTTDEIVKKSKCLKSTVQERLWKLSSVDKVVVKTADGWALKK